VVAKAGRTDAEAGQGMVEYALLVGLALAAIMGAVLVLGPWLGPVFQHMAGCLANAGAC
jgi:Flp pilus assembly pilin Flp